MGCSGCEVRREPAGAGIRAAGGQEWEGQPLQCLSVCKISEGQSVLRRCRLWALLLGFEHPWACHFMHVCSLNPHGGSARSSLSRLLDEGTEGTKDIAKDSAPNDVTVSLLHRALG